MRIGLRGRGNGPGLWCETQKLDGDAVTTCRYVRWRPDKAAGAWWTNLIPAGVSGVRAATSRGPTGRTYNILNSAYKPSVALEEAIDIGQLPACHMIDSWRPESYEAPCAYGKFSTGKPPGR